MGSSTAEFRQFLPAKNCGMADLLFSAASLTLDPGDGDRLPLQKQSNLELLERCLRQWPGNVEPFVGALTCPTLQVQEQSYQASQHVSTSCNGTACQC